MYGISLFVFFPCMPPTRTLVPYERIQKQILLIRDQKVILDDDLADIYGVTTRQLNQQVRRNIDRFPQDFAFILTSDEVIELRLQFATAKTERSKRRTLPMAFTEHGAIMAAAVLNSPIAVAASIQVVRAFVQLRNFLYTQKEFTLKLDELEGRLTEHDKYLATVFDAIRQLMNPPASRKKGTIGFRLD